ncbi:MAG: VWA domain-containing protein, partial [Planctomycetota bacterium]|nr:VWA domain-containing protein [Planctomycetota bacterium]
TRPGWLQTKAVFSSRNILFILDASGTMEKETDGKSRFDMVTGTLGHFLKNIRGNVSAGLRVFGHQFRATDSKANKDSELVLPLRKIDPDLFISSIARIRPKGKSPTTYSLEEAAQDLSRSSSSPSIVILITDGRDSDRTAKPENAAAKLVHRGRGNHLHIIGVQMDDPWWGNQMEKAAKAGNGFYYDTQTEDDFKKALESSVGTAVFVLKSNSDGTEIQGKVGDRKELPPGEYTLIVPGQKTKTISIPPHETLTLDITISSFRRRS